MTTEAVRVKSAGDIVALVPHLVGFQPTESLVVLVMAGERRRHRLAMRIDLVDAAELMDDLVLKTLRADGEGVIIVAYSDGGADDVLTLAHEQFTKAEVDVLDVRWVGQGRHYCRVPDCHRCPDNGEEVPDSTPAQQQYVAAGGRSTVPATRTEAMAQILEPVGDQVPMEGTADIELACTIVVQHVDRQPMAVDLGSIGVVVRTVCASKNWRDLLACIEGEHTVDFWSLVSRHCAQPDVLAITAVHQYIEGNGALAMTAVHRGLAIDPEHTWSHLIAMFIDNALPPQAMRDMLRQCAAEAQS